MSWKCSIISIYAVVLAATCGLSHGQGLLNWNQGFFPQQYTTANSFPVRDQHRTEILPRLEVRSAAPQQVGPNKVTVQTVYNADGMLYRTQMDVFYDDNTSSTGGAGGVAAGGAGENSAVPGLASGAHARSLDSGAPVQKPLRTGFGIKYTPVTTTESSVSRVKILNGMDGGGGFGGFSSGGGANFGSGGGGGGSFGSGGGGGGASFGSGGGGSGGGGSGDMSQGIGATQGFAPMQPINGRAPQEVNNQKFNHDLYQLLAGHNPTMNIVYSPISLQTILALIYTGASGETANELQRALDLPANKAAVSNQYGQLRKSLNSANTKLQMANKLYHQQNLHVQPTFRDNARQYFDADVESVNFGDPQRTAQKINQWVASKTNQRIRNVISPQTLDSRTSAILVNAVYFKAKWANEFPIDETQNDQFLNAMRQQVAVEMMNNEDSFRYAELKDIGAKVLDLPYVDTDMSMMFVLPDAVDGLAAVESQIHKIDFRKLPEQMRLETVKLSIPKFRISYEIEMVNALKMLNITTLFSERANLSGVFMTDYPVGISKVQHEAFIDVNEAGTEATAATYTKFIPLSLPTNIKSFRADHPFMFVIRSPQAVYFVGHVVGF